MRPRAKSFIRPISQIEAKNPTKILFKYDVRGQEIPQIGEKWRKNHIWLPAVKNFQKCKKK